MIGNFRLFSSAFCNLVSSLAFEFTFFLFIEDWIGIPYDIYFGSFCSFALFPKLYKVSLWNAILFISRNAF